MAINTYLSVLKRYNAAQLKAMEWRYHLLCYGTPFIIALVFCFVDTQGRGRMYGAAQLWCWISSDWAFMRIALFYAPAWHEFPRLYSITHNPLTNFNRISIVVSFALYLISGIKIVRNREEIRALQQTSHTSANETFPPYKTTRIDVTSEAAVFPFPKAPTDCFDPKSGPFHSPSASRDYEPYSTMISSSPVRPDPGPSPRQSSFDNPASRRSRAAREDNKAAIKYTKVALLFFTSLCITWVPSSINRIYDLAHPNEVSYALNFISAIVLPLMGFWNGVIYFATSRAVCAAILRDLMERWAPRKRIARGIGDSNSLRKKRLGTASSMTESLVPMEVASCSDDRRVLEWHDLAGLQKDEERY